MFFKKKAENKVTKEEAKKSMTEFLKDLLYEVEAHRQVGIKSGLLEDNDEFFELMANILAEAQEYFRDMSPDEILEDRIENRIGKITDKEMVIKVEL